MNKLFAAILFQLFLYCTAGSQTIKFNRIRQEDGLIHEHVLSMYKDSRGFMWIGTYGGIERFDGYEHRIYLTGMNRPTGIENYTFHCIYEDEKGELWFGTQGGLYHYLSMVDTFFSFQHSAQNPYSISNDNIRSIIKDLDGTFWIGTYGGGLNRFVPDSGKFYHYNHNPLDPQSLPSDMINILFVDSQGKLWVGTDGGGLACLNKKTGKFFSYQKNSQNSRSIQSNIINTIGEDKKGNLWIGTWDGGLSVFNPKDDNFITYKNEPGNPNSLSNNTVRALVVENDFIWLATFGGGLNRFNPQTKEFTIYKNDPFDPASLSLDILWSLYKDRDGILWIGTFGAGICKYDRNRDKFPHFSKERDNKNSLPSNNISALCVDHSGNIWIGSPGNGLTLFDPRSKTYRIYLNELNNPVSFIRSIYEDPYFRLWVGTDKGLVLFNAERKISKYYFDDPKRPYSLKANTIENICMDKQGNMWFASWNNGLFLFPKVEIEKENAKDAHFINYRHDDNDPNSLSWNIVWKVYCDRKGNIWAGTDKTFDKFNEKDQTFSHHNYRMVNTIWEEPSGIMWLGTFGFGLYKYNPVLDTAIVYKENDGFANIVFLGILGDKENNLWISTEGGIYKFNDVKHSASTYFDKDGLQGNKFNFNAYSLSPSGEMLFGGNNGFNIFNPAVIKSDSSQPEIIFTDFKLFNKSVSYEKAPFGTSLIKKQLFLEDTIILSHNQNFISFEFASLCFSNSGDVSYQYKLDGFDKEWHVTKASRREATYTNLNPGTYNFIVKSTNGDGIWSPKMKSMLIIIKPAWYQRWIFKLALLFASFFLLLLFYRLRVKQIKKRNVYLEELVHERTNEIQQKNDILVRQTENLNTANSLLEQRRHQIEEQTDEMRAINEHLLEANATKDRFFSIIAHDLKNPFGNLLGFVELFKKNFKTWDEEKKAKTLEIIDNSAKVIYDLLENLLYWSRSQTNSIRFEPKFLMLSKLVKENLILLKDLYTNKKITLETKIPEDLLIFADEDMLNTVLRNLLMNAMKFTPEKGKIDLYCEVDKDGVSVFIKDSGIGIPDELKEKLFHVGESINRYGTNGEKGTGLGLILCKEFIEKHNGTISFESELNKGTTFIVRFKDFKFE
jgi:signal transduction histidine kinase/ligand-binding sensor domain-containing protein